MKVAGRGAGSPGVLSPSSHIPHGQQREGALLGSSVLAGEGADQGWETVVTSAGAALGWGGHPGRVACTSPVPLKDALAPGHDSSVCRWAAPPTQGGEDSVRTHRWHTVGLTRGLSN